MNGSNYEQDTIVALSTGVLPSGVAIVRLSGRLSIPFANQCCSRFPPAPGVLWRTDIHSLNGEELVDRGMACWFQGPASFTGEDIVEFHLHGSVAVVDALLSEALAAGLRLAEPGEFSRRAFENGKIDLTGIEALSDLLSAETQEQHRLAVRQGAGWLSDRANKWRERLIRARALLEAEFDFSDEEDVPDTMVDEVRREVASLVEEISGLLETAAKGEMVRRGFRVALVGPPNAGKSSLLNALSKRDISIVTEVAGTTRDIIEARVDLGGYAVILSDTAGIRESSDIVEQIGIERAMKAAGDADLTIWLSPWDTGELPPPDVRHDAVFISKSDLIEESLYKPSDNLVSTKTTDGLKPLLDFILVRIREGMPYGEELISRRRQADLLKSCMGELRVFGEAVAYDRVIGAEHLRLAGDALGRLTGRIDPEDLLDVIFAEFCVGK